MIEKKENNKHKKYQSIRTDYVFLSMTEFCDGNMKRQRLKKQRMKVSNVSSSLKLQ